MVVVLLLLLLLQCLVVHVWVVKVVLVLSRWRGGVKGSRHWLRERETHTFEVVLIPLRLEPSGRKGMGGKERGCVVRHVRRVRAHC